MKELTEPKKLQKNKIAGIIIVIIIAVGSVLGSFRLDDPDFHAKTIKTLDKQRNTVTALAGSTAGASIILAAVPGDATTPVAEKLADLSGTCTFILVCILFEKFALTLLGALAFRFVIPIFCVILILLLAFRGGPVRRFAAGAWKPMARITAVVIVAFIAIPLSTIAMNSISAVHEESKTQSMEELNQKLDEIDRSNKSRQKTESNSFWDSAARKFKSGISKVKVSVSKAKETAKAYLTTAIEGVAVMIVNACVIPIVILALLIWLANILIGTHLPIPDPISSGKRISSATIKKLQK